MKFSIVPVDGNLGYLALREKREKTAYFTGTDQGHMIHPYCGIQVKELPLGTATVRRVTHSGTSHNSLNPAARITAMKTP